jgi:hypothetical protein
MKIRKIVDIKWVLLYRLKGQITVYASISIVLVLSLVCTCIKSAGISYIKADLDAAARLSIEAVFSNYERSILDEYDIYLLKNNGEINTVFSNYLIKNVACIKQERNVQLINTDLTESTAVVDAGGIYFRDQILDFMRYAAVPQLLENIKGAEEAKKEVKLSQNLQTRLCNAMKKH